MAQQALIVYYSQFNNTTKLAKLIQDATKAPALRLRVADSVYPNNMEATGRIYQQQLKQRQLPILINSVPQLNQYDVVLVGGPVWNSNVAAPVIEFLKTIQGYQGLIAPFSTAWSDSDDYQANFSQPPSAKVDGLWANTPVLSIRTTICIDTDDLLKQPQLLEQ
jgi:flavodoxin